MSRNQPFDKNDQTDMWLTNQSPVGNRNSPNVQMLFVSEHYVSTFGCHGLLCKQMVVCVNNCKCFADVVFL